MAFEQKAALPGISVDLAHAEMETRIGFPALMAAGRPFPDVAVTSEMNGTVSITIFSPDGEWVETVSGYKVEAGTTVIHMDLPDGVSTEHPATGCYRYEVVFSADDGVEAAERLFFTLYDRLAPGASRTAFLNGAGRLDYAPDSRGNRLPDFSGVGYGGGGIQLPDAPVRETVYSAPGDMTARIQEAIDKVAKLPPDSVGLRGAVLLKAGVYEIGAQLAISASGIVLRGEGQGDMHRLLYEPDRGLTLDALRRELSLTKATVLIATGKERCRIIRFSGEAGAIADPSTAEEITDTYVPVGTNSFHVDRPEKFRVGDPIIVQRTGNAAWISEIGMDRIPPREDGGGITQWSPFELEFEHVITAVEGSLITIDSTIVNAIEARWGGGRIFKCSDAGRISQVGIEHLRAIAYWQPNADGVDDTRHADQFVELDNCKDGWIRHVTAEHFNGVNGAFRTGRGSKSITVEDSSALVADRKFYEGRGYDPTGRTFYETNVYVGRYGFYLNGKSALVQRCFALNNRHGFTLGSRVTGPNVFLDCVGERPLTWSEPHHRWSVGGLYDNVRDKISLMNRLNMGSGHGWAGANYVAWNTEGTLVAQQPPTAQNWAIGHVGTKDNGGNRGPDGLWESHGAHVVPRSLYIQQLRDRLGQEALQRIGYEEQPRE